MAYCAPRGIALSTFLAWSQADQDAAMAWMEQEARRCPGCGTDPQDWASGDAWHVEQRLCPGCAMRESAQKNIPEKAKGVSVRLSRGARHECPSCTS